MLNDLCKRSIALLLGIPLLGAAVLNDQILEANERILARDYASAERILLSALDEATDQKVSDYRLGAVLSNLGHLYRVTSRLADARRYSEDAVAVYSRLDMPRQQATALANLGAVAQDEGDYLSAERNYRQAIGLWATHVVSDSLELAASKNGLAALYISRREFTKAEKLLTDVLEIQRQHLGPASPAIAQTITSLGLVRQETHDFAAAEDYYRQALSIIAAADHRNALMRAAGLHNLALLYSKRVQNARAQKLLLEALEIWRSSLGEQHPLYARGLANLGVVYRDVGRLEQAARLLKQAVQITEDALGPHHPEVGLVLSRYSEVLSRLKRKRDARLTARRAKSILADHAHENLLNQSIHISDLAAFQ